MRSSLLFRKANLHEQTEQLGDPDASEKVSMPSRRYSITESYTQPSFDIMDLDLNPDLT